MNPNIWQTSVQTTLFCMLSYNVSPDINKLCKSYLMIEGLSTAVAMNVHNNVLFEIQGFARIQTLMMYKYHRCVNS